VRTIQERSRPWLGAFTASTCSRFAAVLCSTTGAWGNVTFSDASLSAAPPCSPAGTTGCPWGPGDLVTYTQSEWSQDPLAGSVLEDNFQSVFLPEGATLIVGTGFSIFFDNPLGVLAYLPTSGLAAALDGSVIDPTSTPSGVFGGNVVALKLDVDYSDAGALAGFSALKFGDLTFCNLPATPGYPTEPDALPELNGKTVRQVLALAKTALGGGPSTYTPDQLDELTSTLSSAFEGGFPDLMAQYLYNGPCP
jgi:hypothetical protein